MKNSKAIYALVGALVIVVAGMGYYIYDQNQKKDVIQLKIGDKGISLQTN